MTDTFPTHAAPATVSAGPTIWIMAGEASGDVLGGRLMAALRALCPDVRFAGIGGERMQAQGLHTLFPLRDLAVMGLMEVLPKIRHLSRRLDQAVADIASRRPDLVITIDSPGFTLRLLRRIAPLSIPRLHYVAPQVWAWREHRVREFPGLWERMLCLLPFEPEFFARHGIEARFVGHPVLQSGADGGDGAAFRARHAIAADAPVLVLMPGSRRSEAPRLLPVFGRMLTILQNRVPGIVPVVPVAPVIADIVRRGVAKWPVRPLIVTDVDDKHDAFAAADAALTKSGTSTLELAIANVPMAVTYRVNPLTAAMARRLIRVPYVAMVNLLSGHRLVPELLQERCTPDLLAATVERLLSDERCRSLQRSGFGDIRAALRGPGVDPAQAAAAEIMDLLDSVPAQGVRPGPHPA
ncbi:lipid-A-disaccharide synthase [Komagataeibacter intermedius]|uniref:Lipid-A-disaccharide synthase n=2 Tax=Komagataeibacter intermedius TaxID=66229 RepID=A0A0N1N5B5_9PROT|nr:lipid-A-disaccharide synthase [Komagataeibacter intermedius]KPH88458.1 lipid-A-disaccharide synthase [Komagataeibacter intermedius AF2]MCF3635576.1 lipid-A-disaccharide synthase [Komagataeibacter intermedius]GAN88729.1 lipid-A-disaccharide synthase [Komagataeibacter intermedius TF2]GBQ78959.1 lipid-A-disaccharide synthase [Komagataeibacter intermedius NRIC 0521]